MKMQAYCVVRCTLLIVTILQHEIGIEHYCSAQVRCVSSCSEIVMAICFNVP